MREMAWVRSAWPAPQFSIPVRDRETEWLSIPHSFQSLPGVKTMDTRQMLSLDHLQRQGRLISER